MSNAMEQYLNSYDDLKETAIKNTPIKSGMEFKIILECGRFIYRTLTNDLSLNGFSVVHKIPSENLTSKVTVYISKFDKKDSIQVPAIYLSGSNFKFDLLEKAIADKISSWILH